MRKHVRSPIQWVGGKSRLVDWLLPLLNVPCTLYCEPFGGSAALLLNRRPAPVEVYNDCDGALATLMLCVRDHPAELQRLIAGLPYSRQHHTAEEEWLRLGCPGRMTDLQFAARWWWLNLAGFGGKVDAGFGTHTRESALTGRVMSIDAAARRLEHVLIEHEDFRVILERYDSPGTLFYCDPPYVGAEGVYREGGFSEADHRDLARLLGAIKGKAAVSYYPCPLVDELYPPGRWRRFEKQVHSILGPPDQKGRVRTELLLTNYGPTAQERLAL